MKLITNNLSLNNYRGKPLLEIAAKQPMVDPISVPTVIDVAPSEDSPSTAVLSLEDSVFSLELTSFNKSLVGTWTNMGKILYHSGLHTIVKMATGN